MKVLFSLKVFIVELPSCLVTQSCLTLCDPLDCIAHQSPLSVEFLRQDTKVGRHFFLQRIFLIQG